MQDAFSKIQAMLGTMLLSNGYHSATGRSSSRPYLGGTFALTKEFDLDGKFNIKAGSTSGDFGGSTATLTWGAANAQNGLVPEWPH